MAYLRLLRQSDLRTIQNSYVELFQLQAPSRRALEDALASSRWLSLAAVSPDTSSPSREEYMGGFVMSVVAVVGDFVNDMDYYSSSNGGGNGGGGGGASVGVQAAGLEAIGLPVEERAVNICVLGVLPSYRRRGLARLLLRQVVDSARTASACAVFLHVRSSNTAALALYQSAGFVAAALLPDYYDIDSDGGVEVQAASEATAADQGPRTAGGAAVLLVLPLTEVAAAAVAGAAAGAKAAVEAAVAEAATAKSRGVAGGVVIGVEPAGPAAAASTSSPSAAAARPRGSSRFVGRGVAAEADIDRVTTSTTASTTSPAASRSNSGGAAAAAGGGRGGGGWFGILAAAAVGAMDGLTGLLPGRVRGPGSGAAGEGGGREVQLGGEVLLEERGPDGEVYILGRGGEAEGSGVDARTADAGTAVVAAGGTSGGGVSGEVARAAGGASGSSAAESAFAGGIGGDGGRGTDGSEGGGQEASLGVAVAAASDVAAGDARPNTGSPSSSSTPSTSCRAIGVVQGRLNFRQLPQSPGRAAAPPRSASGSAAAVGSPLGLRGGGTWGAGAAGRGDTHPRRGWRCGAVDRQEDGVQQRLRGQVVVRTGAVVVRAGGAATGPRRLAVGGGSGSGSALVAAALRRGSVVLRAGL